MKLRKLAGVGVLALAGVFVLDGCSSDDADTSGGLAGAGATGGSAAGGSSGGAGTGSSSSGGASGGSTDTPPASMNGMLEAHNEARAAVSPAPSSPMPALSWDSTVAATAQAHADACVFEHSSGSGYGENIYASSGQSSPADVVGSWVSEKKDYDYASNSCSGTCGHYTQVVWAKSLRLGCGVADCTTNSPFPDFNGGKWQFWVCNYDPPGNFNGEKPY